MTKKVKYGLNFEGAEIINHPDKGSLTVVFDTDNGKVKVHFQTDLVGVLRRLYQHCASANNVVAYNVN
jgi:hypothetical protein